ncbi:MAG: hypothetical protein WCI72_03165 [archaeon]
MTNQNKSQLEESLNPISNPQSGHMSFLMVVTPILATSLVAPATMGFNMATGHNIGYVAPVLSTLIPAAMAACGYKFNYLSGKGDPFSDDRKIPTPLKNGAKYLAIGSAVQAASFCIGYGLGCLHR